MKNFTLIVLITLSLNLKAQLTMTSPNGGEIWAAGSVQTIASTITGFSCLNYELSLDSGATYTLFDNKCCLSAGACNLSWTIPNTPSTKCLIRVFMTSGSVTTSDTNNAVFTITGTSGIMEAENSSDYTVFHDLINHELVINFKQSVSSPAVSLYNIIGEEVKQVNAQNNVSSTINIPTAQLPSGIYFISVRNTGTKKIYIL